MSKHPKVAPEVPSELRHELRTPIGQIIGYADLLLEEWEGEGRPALLADLGRIRRAGERLLALVEAHAAAAEPAEPGVSLIPHVPAPFVFNGRTPSLPDADGAGGSILIADDNPENRALLARRLEQQGHACHVVGSGAEALEALAQRPFDVVLLDVMMPEMDGYQVLRRIKSDPALSTTPVIMISAIEDVDSVVRCIETGAADYLPKPFNPVILRARVGACVRDKRLHDREARLYRELQEKYRRERNIADALQRPLLREVPDDAFPRLPVATLYEAALSEAQVGGDLFDAFSLPGGRVALAVADASGKGLAAAARASQVKYALRAYAREFSDDPAGVVAHLNAYLCESAFDAPDLEGGFVCLAFAVVDPDSGAVQIVLAGCEPPLLVRGRGASAEPVEGSGAPLGISAGFDYQVISARMGFDDALVLCTDGITEARSGKDFLGYEGFADLARGAAAEPTVSAMARAILEGARRFGGGTLRDDACLLVARRRPVSDAAPER